MNFFSETQNSSCQYGAENLLISGTFKYPAILMTMTRNLYLRV